MIAIGEIALHLPEEPWVLIFGGVTREGNRRARRAAKAALADGVSVVWFDGYEEQFETGAVGRVPLEGAIVPPVEGGSTKPPSPGLRPGTPPAPRGERSVRPEGSVVPPLESGPEGSVVPPLEGGPDERSEFEGGSAGPSSPRGEMSVLVIGYAARERKHPLLRMLELPDSLERPYLKEASGVTSSVRRLISRTALTVRKKVLRRISLISRGVIGWRLVRADVEGLAATASHPAQIVFGDDFSMTQAWHAARIWPEVRTGMELSQR